MDIETKGLGAGSYPEPPEEHLKEHTVEVHLSFEFESEFPEKWDKERISEEIRHDLDEYVNLKEFEDIDITIW